VCEGRLKTEVLSGVGDSVGWERVRDSGEGRELLTVEGVRGGAKQIQPPHTCEHGNRWLNPRVTRDGYVFGVGRQILHRTRTLRYPHSKTCRLPIPALHPMYKTFQYYIVATLI